MVMKAKWAVATVATSLLIALHLSFAPFASAQEQPKGGSTGTTVGAVMEITDDFLLIRTPNDSPRRHWFKAAGDAAAKPDKELQASVARLKVGDWVEARWSFEDRRRLESVTLSA